MCGRYGFSATESELSERFDLEAWEFELRDSYNVAPTQTMPVIERHSPNSLHLASWGYKPGWSKMLLINAKTEKLMESRVWKTAFLENRCIIPANYFIEWKVVDGAKQPILIKLKNRSLFGMAGLVFEQEGKAGVEKVYVDITTSPNSLLEKIHARMTSILRPEDEDGWLNPDTEPERLLKMLEPYPTSEMEAYPIDQRINSPRNNDVSLIKPTGAPITA